MTSAPSQQDALSILGEFGIVPVVEIPEARLAVPLARALSEAGLTTIEVTMRTPDALESIANIAAELPEFHVGVGTLFTAANVADAKAAGARFGVSPGYTPQLGLAAREAGLPLIPGAATASEIMAAVEDGFDIVKFFPAELNGGAKALAALLAPLAASGLRHVMPTGGVTPDNLGDYLRIPRVIAAGGTWIAPRGLIAVGEFDIIRDNAARALELARTLLREKDTV
ncbi:bifunctional 4-hydroxy-2-oxoglutarate aldolase/2-dehydro-3-deoxy-phosphogluconate aldolase [Mycetocola tolaasinivorans]|uniref:Bifunctional 4-hydroxy-2-oxoglutarate aldolase/2-dehydro-3-deoxy-phosphogluconate aldolase n=1 Tax=Mycetocola tolaasinivorans TaxID=76635 RepID=A0A3L7A360_9MICO|nr:bifunctional 4-hydroxy-2-oxoglutarate aldolase/2-dehydro-3-deoxy-phosphogluconate aldolase [Mycetocola tolaasinivorans]RLP74766.1 bifunctional 4-hydroxy-2-oxoglutarate aldolase/2-dehydro-3-deoxy-phosphogluconate aldolase [Mycetocola tolaasinivorans]